MSELDALLEAGDPALYDIQTAATGPQGKLPLTDDMLRTWSSGDLFGLTQAAGMGWTQCEGEAIVEIRAGDVIWCPPGHRHWHGASPTTAMTHIAIQEALDGRMVEWMEHVTDQQYLAGPSAA